MEGPLRIQQAVGTVSGSFYSAGHNGAEHRSYTWTAQNNEMHSYGHHNHPFAGGPWYSSRRESRRSVVSDTFGTSFRKYEGGVVINSASSPPKLSMPKTLRDSELDAYGTSAIAAVEPTASEWSLATALGELRRDGIPDLPGTNMRDEVRRIRSGQSSASSAGSSAGSDYLNMEFGWLPLKRDFQSFIKAVRDSDDIIRQYKRDSGQKIRRRAGGPAENEVVRKNTSFHLSPNPSSAVGSGSGYTQISTTSRKWFSGAFVYHIPEVASMGRIREYALMARRLHGLEITPEVIWNVSPWTWAADWFGNFGDVMHNVSALGRDGLVLRYGYVMHERTRVTRMSGIVNQNGAPIYREDLESVKIRRPATPYGFGLSWDGFTPKQLAIISALGMSRM